MTETLAQKAARVLGLVRAKYKSPLPPEIMASIASIARRRQSSAAITASISVSPMTPVVVVGRTVQLVVRNQIGQQILSNVTWTSSAPAFATVGAATGIVTGVAAGAVTFTASYNSGQFTATTNSITVAAQVLTTTAMTTAPSQAIVTHNVAFAATGYDQTGAAMTTQPTFTYVSATPANATINSVTGVASGVAVGTSVITATSSGPTTAGVTLTMVAQVPFHISTNPPSFTIAAAGTQQIVAIATDQLGGPITTPPVTWDSSNTGVATVDASGLVTGVGNGSVTITATAVAAPSVSGATSGSVTSVTLTPTTLVWLDNAPTMTSIGGTASLRAQINDQNGQAMASQSGISYTSATTAKVTITSPGAICTAVANGTSVITAAFSGVTSITRTATVAQAVASAGISPSTVTLAPSGTQQYTLTPVDALGVAVSSPPTPTWYAGNNADGSAFGTVTVGGLFTAPASGTGYINATYPNSVQSSFAGITVSGASPSLDHLKLVLSASSATLGSTAPTLTTQKWGNAGETTPFTGSVTLTYASTTPATATVASGTGVITLVAAGTCTFTVTDSITNKTATSGTLTVSAGGTGSLNLTNGQFIMGSNGALPIAWMSGDRWATDAAFRSQIAFYGSAASGNACSTFTGTTTKAGTAPNNATALFQDGTNVDLLNLTSSVQQNGRNTFKVDIKATNQGSESAPGQLTAFFTDRPKSLWFSRRQAYQTGFTGFGDPTNPTAIAYNAGTSPFSSPQASGVKLGPHAGVANYVSGRASIHGVDWATNGFGFTTCPVDYEWTNGNASGTYGIFETNGSSYGNSASDTLFYDRVVYAEYVGVSNGFHHIRERVWQKLWSDPVTFFVKIADSTGTVPQAQAAPVFGTIEWTTKNYNQARSTDLAWYLSDGAAFNPETGGLNADPFNILANGLG